MLRVSIIALPAMLLAALCWDPTLRRRAARALGPLYMVSEPQELRVAAPARYEPCVAGCCDDDPAFCALLEHDSPFGSMEHACGYATVRSRCVRSCGRCHQTEEEAECEDVWPDCPAVLETSPGFCATDNGVSDCRRTCGHCARPVCADSLTHRKKCQRAKQDLRECARPGTAVACPQTCGQCTKVGLQELLRRQPCQDAPGCELSDDEVADATLAKFRSCEDIGFCGVTRTHPTTESLCADAMFRDTLCRGTCGGCTPSPPLPPTRFLAETRKSQPAQCSALKARTCPKKCGVCRASGRRSIWQVDELERLVLQGPLRPKP